VTLIVLILAVFRVTRLATTDTIFDTPRNWVHDHSSFFSEMLDCDWCASFWVAVPVAVAYWLWPDVTFWLSLPFALSAVVGLLTRFANPDS